MASPPNTRPVTHEEWLEIPEFERPYGLCPRGRAAVLKPRAFPHVEIDIAHIWPD